MHLLVPEVYIEQFSIAKVVMHLLVPEVYIKQFGIAKVVMHLLGTSRCMTTLAIINCSI
jgi:hypothetical protein